MGSNVQSTARIGNILLRTFIAIRRAIYVKNERNTIRLASTDMYIMDVNAL